MKVRDPIELPVTDQRTLVDRYELVSRIGSGGMADVYRARSLGVEGFEKTVVLKRIRPELSGMPRLRDQLIAEAKLCSRLEHPNIVQIFDLVEDGADLYLVMEYVRGGDVLHLLKRCTASRVRVPSKIAVTIVAGVAKALAYAHGSTDADGVPLGIVHCDVSPSNVLVSRDGAVKLVDFGVARATAMHHQRERAPESEPANRRPRLRGKLSYMAPETLLHGRADARSDVFALGTLLWEVLTLRRLFRGRTNTDTMRNIATCDVDDRLARHDYIPPRLAAIVRRAIAKDPAERYQASRAMLDDLLDFMFDARLRLSEHDVAAFLRDLIPEPYEERLTTPTPPPLPSVVPPPLPGASSAAPEGDAAWDDVTANDAASGVADPDGDDGDLLDGLEVGDLEAIVDAFGADDDADAPPGTSAMDDDVVGELQSLLTDDAGPASVIPRDLPVLPSLEELLSGRSLGVDHADASWLRLGVPGAERGVEAAARARRMYSGVFDRQTLLAFVARLVSDRATGAATFARPGRAKQIHFDEGRIVHVTSTLDRELLANQMLRDGFIAEPQAIAGLAYSKQRGLPVGKALVEIDALTEVQLRHTLRKQVESRFLELFGWPDGEVTWAGGDLAPEGADPDGSEVLSLFGHVVRHCYDHGELLTWLMPWEERRIARRHGLDLDALGLTDAELRAARALARGGIRLRDVLARATERNALLRTLFLLLQTFHVQLLGRDERRPRTGRRRRV